MLFRFADNRDPDSLAVNMRKKRMSVFVDAVNQLGRPANILDVGGTLSFWQTACPELVERHSITVMNLLEQTERQSRHFTAIQGDARDLSRFTDNEFDFCFSNSVIEHVGSLYDQMTMARELQRVCKWYFVQTPNFYFPIEPHFHMPFWPLWPKPVRAFLLQKVSLGWMEKQPDPLKARAEIDQVRLLTKKEMTWLFPQADIQLETLGPFTKSIIARSLPA